MHWKIEFIAFANGVHHCNISAHADCFAFEYINFLSIDIFNNPRRFGVFFSRFSFLNNMMSILYSIPPNSPNMQMRPLQYMWVLLCYMNRLEKEPAVNLLYAFLKFSAFSSVFIIVECFRIILAQIIITQSAVSSVQRDGWNTGSGPARRGDTVSCGHGLGGRDWRRRAWSWWVCIRGTKRTVIAAAQPEFPLLPPTAAGYRGRWCQPKAWHHRLTVVLTIGELKGTGFPGVHVFSEQLPTWIPFTACRQ